MRDYQKESRKKKCSDQSALHHRADTHTNTHTVRAVIESPSNMFLIKDINSCYLSQILCNNIVVSITTMASCPFYLVLNGFIGLALIHLADLLHPCTPSWALRSADLSWLVVPRSKRKVNIRYGKLTSCF